MVTIYKNIPIKNPKGKNQTGRPHVDGKKTQEWKEWKQYVRTRDNFNWL
jgi:hypothetical protein